jgi:hypothetical protein
MYRYEGRVRLIQNEGGMAADEIELHDRSDPSLPGMDDFGVSLHDELRRVYGADKWDALVDLGRLRITVERLP